MIKDFVKKHKIYLILVLVIIYLIYGKFNFSPINLSTSKYSNLENQRAIGNSNLDISYNTVSQGGVPLTSETKRLTIQNSDLSILVSNIKETALKISDYTLDNGGFMVNSSFSNPNDEGSGNITVRIPQRKFKEALVYFESISVKVIYENLNGEDVTDQYTDIKSRLITLYTTKTKFEEILNKATLIPDILNVQREIINLQMQIDDLKGQEMYLEKNSDLSKITIYLSTDELELPYQPKEVWRAEVIFKRAVRSLIQNLREATTLIIWIVVYSLIWLPLLLVGLIVKRRFNKKSLG